MERAEKLSIMGRLKSAGLWEEAEEYREEVRQRLRAKGKSKQECVAGAWKAVAAKFLPLAQQAMPGAARLAAMPPPPLAPVDLDTNYREKDFASAQMDSLIWVISETRRMMVNHGTGYKVDFSRARTKPPTALAMHLAEIYAVYPEKFERINQLLHCLLWKQGKSDKASTGTGVAEKRVKSQKELEVEAYLRSVGVLRQKE
jgi:hypothetical protein